MKKNSFVFVVMLAMVLAFGLAVVGCDPGNNNDDNNNNNGGGQTNVQKLIGAWRRSSADGVTIFYADGTGKGYYTYDGYINNPTEGWNGFTWTATETHITIPDVDDEPFNYSISPDGNTLTFGGVMVGTYTRIN